MTEVSVNIAALPRIDEHVTLAAARADDVWQALGETLEQSFGRPRSARYARLVGVADRTASGPRPLAEGSVLPGFRVADAVPGRKLVLVGRHHFSTYALVFRIEQADGGRTRLRAESRARFPGPGGALYRLLVISSGAHALLTGRLVASVRRRAERLRWANPTRSA
ncbi:hypothetical protein M2164_007078 [Streptomyces sp. SAI-208]|uniref:hypothetical protein n=1 Tax=unclassified Streptomyces TaxID=2593676 RepID=UPI00247636EF|nr:MULTISPECIES: hypothetical protein [unclassified Streptomyces]MDH6552677.1 hypothetical protein [Streptomyces sp. SAI-041]MDH6611443.1 hypothetical protein [Streptomyces sp. SAI-208]